MTPAQGSPTARPGGASGTGKNVTNTPRRPISSVHVHLAGGLGVLCLGGLVYALGYTPWTQARQQVLAQQQAIASAENQAQDLANQLRLALAEHAALENKARAAPIARHELADRIGDALAGCALSVHNLVVGQATEADGLSVTPVDVQASGRFEEIVSWLGKVRQDLPGVSVVGLSVLPQPSDESMLMVQASLKAYAPQTTPPAGDQGQ